jgi:hypothetical protein
MTRERRSNQKPVPDGLEKILNGSQLAALRQIRQLGWRLEFVRRPLFMDPVPVVYNAKSDEIGVLDPDGILNVGHGIDVRSGKNDPKQQSEMPGPWEEKRKGIVPVPEDVDGLLNLEQLHTLRKIEKFGWRVYFVRRPLFQKSVTAIISPKGDKVAVLEYDGRINLLPDSEIRKDALADLLESAPDSPDSEGRQAS